MEFVLPLQQQQQQQQQRQLVQDEEDEFTADYFASSLLPGANGGSNHDKNNLRTPMESITTPSIVETDNGCVFRANLGHIGWIFLFITLVLVSCRLQEQQQQQKGGSAPNAKKKRHARRRLASELFKEDDADNQNDQMLLKAPTEIDCADGLEGYSGRGEGVRGSLR